MVRILSIIVVLLIAVSCIDKNDDVNLITNLQYNLIEPGNDIYVIQQENVSSDKIIGKNHEKVYYVDNKIDKIERYDEKGNLTDGFSVSAITSFEYDSNGRVKYLRYFDKDGRKWEDDVFGYWSVEYIYDEKDRVRMEIYRDAESRFLEVPRDNSGNIAKINFLAPVLSYEYIDDQLRIKALDQNFNLLKEVLGDKPCIPFIDCGEND